MGRWVLDTSNLDAVRQALDRSLPSRHPGGNPGANRKSITLRCYLFKVAFVWELTKETIVLPMGCLQGGPTSSGPAASYSGSDVIPRRARPGLAGPRPHSFQGSPTIHLPSLPARRPHRGTLSIRKRPPCQDHHGGLGIVLR